MNTLLLSRRRGMSRLVAGMIGACTLSLLLDCTAPARADTPALDPELQALAAQGKLTVRALRAWGLLPDAHQGLVMALHARSLDLLAADQAQVERWIEDADRGRLSLSPDQLGHLKDLQALMGRITTLSIEASGADSALAGALDIEQTWTLEDWESLDKAPALMPGGAFGALLFAQDPMEAAILARLERPEGFDPPLRLDARATRELLFPPEKDIPDAAAAAAPTPPPGVPTLPEGLIRAELAQGVNTLGDTYWAGQVIFAMQGMRMLYGVLSEADEAAFSRLWAPLFEHPSETVLAWLQALNPLLMEFLAAQQEMAALLEVLDEADFAVELAMAYGEDEDIDAAMNRVGLLSARIGEVKQHMEQVVAAIDALGSPPDVRQEQERARARTRQAVELVKSLAPPTEVHHVPRPGWSAETACGFAGGCPRHEDFGELSKVFHYAFEHRLLRWDGSISRDQITAPLMLVFVIHDSVPAETIVQGRWAGWQWIDEWMIPHFISPDAGDWVRTDRMQGRYDDAMTGLTQTTVDGHPALRWPYPWLYRIELVNYLIQPGGDEDPRILVIQVPNWAAIKNADLNLDLIARHQSFELDAMMRHLRIGSDEEGHDRPPGFPDIALEYIEFRQQTLEWLAGVVRNSEVVLEEERRVNLRQLAERVLLENRNRMEILRSGRYRWTPTFLSERWAEHGYGDSGRYGLRDARLGQSPESWLPTARVVLEPGAPLDLLPQPIEEVGEFAPCVECRVLMPEAIPGHPLNEQYEHRTVRELVAAGRLRLMPTDHGLPVGNLFGVGDLDVARIDIPAVPEGSPAPADDDPLQARVRFHENNIGWLQGDIQRLEQALRGSGNEDERRFLGHQLTIKRADLQGERDAITTLRTGNFVRTPTAWDQLVKEQMLAQGREMAARVERSRRNLDRIEHMMDTLPPEERRDLRDWVDRQLRDAGMDLERQAQVGQLVARNLQARAEQQRAAAQEDEAWAQLAVDILENYQQAATYAMYATPFVSGGGVLSVAYGITSGGIAGYAEQGDVHGAIRGAALTSLRYWSPKADYALTAYEGYQAGGVEGAARRVASTYVQRKVVQTATQAALNVQGQIQASHRQARREAWREAQRKVNFREERAAGRALAEQHQAQFAQVRRLERSMRQQGYIEVDGVRYSGDLMWRTRTWTDTNRALMDTTAAIKHSPHAKFWMKRGADPLAQRDYNFTDRLHTRQVVRDLRADLQAQGIAPDALQFRPIRNAGNSSPGMDLDLAMRFTGDASHLRRIDPATGQAQQLSLAEANAFVQGRFNRVYARNAGGRSADGSWQMVTSSAHPEAYQDTAWLHVRDIVRSGADPNSVINPRHAAQAGGVTVHKAHEMRRFIGMGTDNQNFEIYRGTAKDIDSKVIPLLQSRVERAPTPSQRQEARGTLDFYRHLSRAMNLAVNDPISADKSVRQLTGMDTLGAVELVGGAIEALGQGR
ncbi:hypothetical protein [Ectothiorhodospira sp. BSL-9]|uniref:hypothetical protein n=1 Tax=Ectothiorhodospira sp. BSL-9 TaxID=1442136 RepID=UPI0007B43CBC|nr:hypothetical protein [Ectothiorhodospira sp. BSL-9]ANB01907.1 hypothetical protein ECTOBSL9_1145 [Ectothiorhodospira sp. BSL-9]